MGTSAVLSITAVAAVKRTKLCVLGGNGNDYLSKCSSLEWVSQPPFLIDPRWFSKIFSADFSLVSPQIEP